MQHLHTVSIVGSSPTSTTIKGIIMIVPQTWSGHICGTSPLINKAGSKSQDKTVLDLPSGFNDMDAEDYKACKL